MTHFYQVIRSKRLFVIHNYEFGVLRKDYAASLDELSRSLRNVPRHYEELAVIHTTDGEVCRQSACPTVKPKDVAA